MTDVLIKRELLEQAAFEFEHDNDRYMIGRELRKALAAAPSAPKADPVKVQLLEALEGMVEYFPEGSSDGECFSVDAARAAIAAARKGEGNE